MSLLPKVSFFESISRKTRFSSHVLGGWVLSFLLIASAAHAAESTWGTNNAPAWATPTAAAPRRVTSYTSPGRSASEISRRNPVTPFAPGSHNLSLDIGQIFLMGDLSTNYANAIGGRVHYTYGVSDLFGFEAMLGRSSHSEGKFSVTTALAGLRTNLAWFDKVVPYVSFGLGFYKPSYQYSLTNSVSPVLFGVHVGPGISLEITDNVFFGASLTFHDVFGGREIVAGLTSAAPAVAVDVGGTFTSFLLNAGYSF